MDTFRAATMCEERPKPEKAFSLPPNGFTKHTVRLQAKKSTVQSVPAKTAFRGLDPLSNKKRSDKKEFGRV